MKNIKPDGVHYLVGIFGCNRDQIDSVNFWKNILPNSISKTKLSVLHSHYHKFNPGGVTAFLLLSSSHVSVHTWPEFNYVALDMFSCSNIKVTDKAVKYIINNIEHNRADIRIEKRGYAVDIGNRIK